MEYRRLGATGLEVSSVGTGWGGVAFGTGRLQDPDVVAEAVATIHRAESLGVNLLDTAEAYSGGRSEEVIGEAIKGRRDSFVVVTKVIPVTSDPGETRSRPDIVAACEGSLRRLQTDCIDVYMLHDAPRADIMPVAMEQMARLKEQGKIRWIGLSSNDTEATRKLLALGELAVVEIGYSLLNRTGLDALRLAKEGHLGTMVRSPLASGVLSGRYFSTPAELEPDDPRRERFTSDRVAAAFQKLSELAFLTAGGRRPAYGRPGGPALRTGHGRGHSGNPSSQEPGAASRERRRDERPSPDGGRARPRNRHCRRGRSILSLRALPDPRNLTLRSAPRPRR